MRTSEKSRLRPCIFVQGLLLQHTFRFASVNTQTQFIISSLSALLCMHHHRKNTKVYCMLELTALCLNMQIWWRRHCFPRNICMSKFGVHVIQFITLLTYKVIGVAYAQSACKLQWYWLCTVFRYYCSYFRFFATLVGSSWKFVSLYKHLNKNGRNTEDYAKKGGDIDLYAT